MTKFAQWIANEGGVGKMLTALAFAIIGVWNSKETKTALGVMFAAFTSLCVGLVAGHVAEEMLLPPGQTYAVVALASLIANDLVRFALALSGFINARSSTIFNLLLDRVIARWFK